VHPGIVYEVKNWFESFSYWAIWILPLLFMLPYALSVYRRKKQVI